MFIKYVSPKILQWMNFLGHEEPQKISKIRSLQILNLAHFFDREFRDLVKH